MSWSKKHFIAVADILKSVTDTNIRQGLAQKFSALFIQMNPRFSADKFNDYVMGEDDSMSETYKRKVKITTEDINRIANRIVEMRDDGGRRDITDYGERELYMWFMNDEYLYNAFNKAYNEDMIEDLARMEFKFTDEQLDYLLDEWREEQEDEY